VSRRLPYEYAVVRVVPDIARAEFVNAGVLLYSREAEYLDAIVALDEQRLRALAPGIDVDAVRRSLAAITDCAPAVGESIGQRFRWLTMPRSTVVQTSPIHTGTALDPGLELQRLAAVLVRAK
jgi:hypothetical protein